MEKENPVATVSKWLLNFEQQEDRLQAELDQLEEKVDAARSGLCSTRSWITKLREILADLRSLNPASLELFAKEADENARKETGTHFERIHSFLDAKPTPQTITEIESATGISRTSISAVLYRTHKDQFVFHELAAKRGKAWRLQATETDAGPPPSEGEDIPF